MIEQIQKFQNSGRVKRHELAEKQAAFNAAYAAATPEQQQQVDAYMQSTRNYSSANPATNSNARRYAADAYDIAIKILNGEQVQGAGTPTDVTSAYNVYSQFKAHNAKKAARATPSTESGGQKYYRYNWSKGLDSDWLSDDDTLEQRMSAFAQTLRDNINSAKNSGRTVLGIDDTAMSNALALLNKETWTKDDMKTLRRAAQYAGVDAAAFKSYFGDLMPKSSAQDKAKRKLLSQGYTEIDLNTDVNSSEWLRNYAKTHNYHFMRDKEGNIKIFDNSYTNPITGILDYNYNSDDEGVEGKGYGHALISDENGNTFFGDSSQIGKNSPFASLWNARLAADRAKRDRLYFDIDYNVFADDSDSPYLQALETKFGNFKGSDVSSLFQGDDKIFVTSKDKVNPYYTKNSIFGGIKFNNNAEFYKVGEDGKIDKVSWDELKPLYNSNGWEGEAEEQLGKKIDLTSKLDADTTTFDDTMDMGGRSAWDATKDNFGFGGQWWHALTSFVPGAIPIRYAFYDNVNEDRIGFIHNLLNAVRNKGQGELHTKLSGVSGNADLLSKLKYNEKKAYYVKGLYDMFKNDPSLWEELSPEEKATFKAMEREYNKIKKNGGVLKAAKGTVLTMDGEVLEDLPFENPSKTKSNADLAKLRARYEESNEKGYGDNLYRMDAAQEKVFKGNTAMTTADIMRLTTMAQDVASIVASFVPGVGTGVAAGLGVTSTLTDLGADIIDPQVSAGEAAKNAVVNAGFAALGIIPGVKMGKVAKTLIKWVPKIMTVAAGMGIAMDESTQNTFKKLGDGTQKLNREDWKNISHVLSLIAGGTRGVKGDITSYKAKKIGTIAKDNVIIKGVKDPVTGNDLQLPKKTIESINKDLKGAKTIDEAEAKLLGLKNEQGQPVFTKEQVGDLLKENNWIKGKVGQKFQIDTEKISETANEEAISGQYDKIRQLWNKDADAIARQQQSASGRAAIWFANKFGGGAYGANQRALLSNDDTRGVVNQALEYQGVYNPMIDWKSLRNGASTKMREAGPKTKKPEGSNTAEQSIDQQQRAFDAEIGRENVSDELNNKFSGNWRALSSKNYLDLRMCAERYGQIKIDNEANFKQFLISLKQNQPERYKQLLTNHNWMSQAKEAYQFKLGGFINYKKLRK